MNAKLFAAAAFALALVPAVASAASTFDPGAGNASPTFVTTPAPANSANAAAAAADAQAYSTVASSAVVGTHGASPATVTEYDPGLASGTDFVTTTVLKGASAPVAQSRHIPYAENSDVIGN